MSTGNQFALIPWREQIRSGGLRAWPDAAVSILPVLAVHESPLLEAWPSQTRIASLAGVSKTTLGAGLRFLVEQGWISLTKRKTFRAWHTVYRMEYLHYRKGYPVAASLFLALPKALTQTAMRGASALAGCIRWGMLVAPLGAALAQKRIGEPATGKYDGAFLAVRVGKKNSGGPEPRYYLGRDEHGLLYRVDPDARQEEGDVVWDAHQLAEEVERRQRAGEKPLSATKGGQEAFGWGISRTQKARERAIELGLLIEIRNSGKKGRSLTTPSLCSKNTEGSDYIGT